MTFTSPADQAEVEALDIATLDVVLSARGDHTAVPDKEGFVDCSCGWQANRVYLPTDEQVEALKACLEFDAVKVPLAPFLPQVYTEVTPTPEEIDEVHAYNAWARIWTMRVRPPWPGDNAGAPDPDRTNDTEWQMHLGSVGRDAAVEKHLSDGGTLFNLPENIAMLGVSR